MNAVTLPATTTAAVPKAQFDWLPLALVPLVALVAFPLVGSPSTWLTFVASVGLPDAAVSPVTVAVKPGSNGSAVQLVGVYDAFAVAFSLA